MTSDDRRKALRAAKTVNGLDFVEVDPADATKLIAHLVLNRPDAASDPVPNDASLALTREDFRISGGERISDIAVTGAGPRPGTEDQMDIAVDRVGDFSPYTLDLSKNGTTPAGFDPRLVSAPFFFHVDCAADFDCAPVATCPPELGAPPPIDYLAKDYPGLLKVMLDRIALLAPRWQERNPADLGVALVEALAYVGDHLSYRQDVIATEAYLGTARLRTSARRHARLVDYAIGEGSNARAWLRLLLADGASGVVLPSDENDKIRCATSHPGAAAGALVHETRAYEQAIDGGAVFFEFVPMPDPPALEARHGEMPLYAWSDTRACLPVGATHATLAGAFPQLKADMVLILAEAKGPLTGDPADADPEHRQAVSLTAVVVTKDPLDGADVTEIDWDPADALTFPVCIASVTDAAHGSRAVDGVAVAWGNVVLADHGRTIGGSSDPFSTAEEPDEIVGTVGARGRFRPQLANGPLTFAEPPPAGAGSAAAIAGGGGTAIACASLTSVDSEGSREQWRAVADLLDAGFDSGTRVFVPEVESDGTAFILFGDGVDGTRPEPGMVFSARYRVGNGRSGNVARETIVQLDPTNVPSGVTGVTNPLPAWGGTDPETVEHVRQSAPIAFRRTQERAVTALDYETLATSRPEVERAAATLRWTGSWYTESVTVERASGATLTAPLADELEEFLDRYRLAGIDLQLEEGTRVPLLLRMSFCVEPGYVATDVDAALRSLFSAGVLPDGSLGLFNPARLDLGQPLYLSPLVAAAQDVDGVQSVEVTAFERQDQPGGDGLRKGVLVPGRLEFFALDNDPNFPERGRFELTVRGGL